nr:MAG TPA: hypothetical protein [Caudoviricetes sp.]
MVATSPLGLVRRHRRNSCCKKLVITSPMEPHPLICHIFRPKARHCSVITKMTRSFEFIPCLRFFHTFSGNKKGQL